MTLDQFAAITQERIPTVPEFVAFAQGQGWQLTLDADGKGHLTVPGGADDVAKGLARMLAREPYRSGVLAHLQATWRQDQPREWLWRTGHVYVEEPADEWLYGYLDRHPAGAGWWRRVGESHWHRIDGRGDPSYQIPQEVMR